MIQARTIDQACLTATARLREHLFLAPDARALTALFADMLAEHGIDGHALLAAPDGPVWAAHNAHQAHHSIPTSTGVLFVASPRRTWTGAERGRVEGYAQLYAAQIELLVEQADDVATPCGLTLRERTVLGRRLAGLSPIDIAADMDLSVTTISAALDSAVAQLGGSEAEAVALAARRGWLVVPRMEKPFLSFGNITYNRSQSGA